MLEDNPLDQSHLGMYSPYVTPQKTNSHAKKNEFQYGYQRQTFAQNFTLLDLRLLAIPLKNVHDVLLFVD